MENVITEQKNHQPPSDMEIDDAEMYWIDHKTWIPDETLSLKLCKIVIVHCEHHGNRAYDTTLETVTKIHWRTSVKKDVNEFIQSCIHCIVSRTEERIRRSITNALHGSKAHDVVHADFFQSGLQQITNKSVWWWLKMTSAPIHGFMLAQMQTGILLLLQCRNVVLASTSWNGLQQSKDRILA